MVSPTNSIEETIVVLVQWLKLGVETVGAVLVLLGVCVAVVQLIGSALSRRPAQFTPVRLILARYLALAIEFELGADILGTAISPTWDQIGKLGAIAVIRTGPELFPFHRIETGDYSDRTRGCNDRPIVEARQNFRVN